MKNETNDNTADTTISDIHRVREELSAKFGGNIAAILADARERQAASGRRVLSRGELSGEIDRKNQNG
jgi:hypothetical protein